MMDHRGKKFVVVTFEWLELKLYI